MQGPGSYGNTFTIPQGATSGQRITIDGTRGAIFEYNSSNQLVGSWADSAGTNDGYGNAYLEGQVTYLPGAGGTTSIACQNSDGTIAYWYASSPAGPWSEVTALGLILGATLADTYVQWSTYYGGLELPPLFEIQGITPGTNGTAEYWHPLTLASGWSAVAGFHTPSYRLNALGNVELTGRITNPSAAEGSEIASLPSGYYSSSYNLVTTCGIQQAVALSTTRNIELFLGTAGKLNLFGISATAGSTTVDIDSTFKLSAG